MRRTLLTTSARHLASIVLLPFMVVVVVPSWLLSSWAEVDYRWSGWVPVLVGRALGLLIGVAGILLFIWCVALFARVGRGTLAPWDPTKRLVAVGPYRHVRNPMISAVAALLLGEALYFGSAMLAGWSVLFIVVNHLYFLVSEELGLERRFGAAYADYKRSVPRWLPRAK
jgi:protein-S-isoprenylcysteine O-methyltransferase Ste14